MFTRDGNCSQPSTAPAHTQLIEWLYAVDTCQWGKRANEKRSRFTLHFGLESFPLGGGTGGSMPPKWQRPSARLPPTHPSTRPLYLYYTFNTQHPQWRRHCGRTQLFSLLGWPAGPEQPGTPGGASRLTWPSPVQLDLGRCQQGADHVCNVAEGGGSQQGGRADHAKHHVQGGGHQAEQQGQEVGALRGRGVKGVGVGVGVGGSGVVGCGWRAGVPSQAAKKRRDRRGEVR